jgi:transposase
MEKFKKIYKTLFQTNKESFINMESIVKKLESSKNEKYIHNKKYSTREYVCGIVEVLSNNVSWRKYNGKINGRVLNNKHNYYSKIGVYEELYKINLIKYLKLNKSSQKYLSIDSSFITNKEGKEKIGRNIYYKNKQGRKITSIVDEKGTPLLIKISKGNRHDARIAPKILEKVEPVKIKEERYILADKGYDSKKIREIIRKKGYKPVIAKRKYKNGQRSLKKSEIKKYRKRIIVENFFAWIKAYPKINIIYEKTLKSYTGLLLLGISMFIYKRT